MWSNRPGVGRRVGARRAPDRRLVDVDDLVEGVDPLDPAVRARPHPRPVQAVLQRPQDHLVDERRLARARHARDRHEPADRDLDVDVAQVVLRTRRAPAATGRPAAAAPGSRCAGAPTGTRAVTDSRLRSTSSGVPSAMTRPPCSPAPRPMSMSQSDARMVSSSCSTMTTVLPRSRSRVERLDQAPVVALVQADRRLVEDVEHADQARPDLRREPDALRLAAGQRRRRRGRATGSRRRRRRGTTAARGSRAARARRSGARSPTARASSIQSDAARTDSAGHLVDRGSARPSPRAPRASAARPCTPGTAAASSTPRSAPSAAATRSRGSGDRGSGRCPPTPPCRSACGRSGCGT